MTSTPINQMTEADIRAEMAETERRAEQFKARAHRLAEEASRDYLVALRLQLLKLLTKGLT